MGRISLLCVDPAWPRYVYNGRHCKGTIVAMPGPSVMSAMSFFLSRTPFASPEDSYLASAVNL